MTTADAASAGGMEAPVSVPQSAKPVRPDTSTIDVEELAKIILAREIKPRVGEIRRIAEAVLRKKDRKRAKKAMKAAAKDGRKLSKIPARKSTK